MGDDQNQQPQFNDREDRRSRSCLVSRSLLHQYWLQYLRSHPMSSQCCEDVYYALFSFLFTLYMDTGWNSQSYRSHHWSLEHSRSQLHTCACLWSQETFAANLWGWSSQGYELPSLSEASKSISILTQLAAVPWDQHWQSGTPHLALQPSSPKVLLPPPNLDFLFTSQLTYNSYRLPKTTSIPGRERCQLCQPWRQGGECPKSSPDSNVQDAFPLSPSENLSSYNDLMERMVKSLQLPVFKPLPPAKDTWDPDRPHHPVLAKNFLNPTNISQDWKFLPGPTGQS